MKPLGSPLSIRTCISLKFTLRSFLQGTSRAETFITTSKYLHHRLLCSTQERSGTIPSSIENTNAPELVTLISLQDKSINDHRPCLVQLGLGWLLSLLDDQANGLSSSEPVFLHVWVSREEIQAATIAHLHTVSIRRNGGEFLAPQWNFLIFLAIRYFFPATSDIPSAGEDFAAYLEITSCDFALLALYGIHADLDDFGTKPTELFCLQNVAKHELADDRSP
jgi:hypothetical protein